MKLLTKHQTGFTLVEFLLYMGLLSILLVVLTQIFVAILEVRTESEATSAVEQNGRFLMSRLAYDIARASSVSTPAAVGGSGSSLALVIGGVTYTYALSSSNLQLTNNLGTDNLNGSEVTISSPTFQRIAPASGKDTIRMQLTVTSVAQRKGGAESKVFTITAARRN